MAGLWVLSVFTGKVLGVRASRFGWPIIPERGVQCPVKQRPLTELTPGGARSCGALMLRYRFPRRITSGPGRGLDSSYGRNGAEIMRIRVYLNESESGFEGFHNARRRAALRLAACFELDGDVAGKGDDGKPTAALERVFEQLNIGGELVAAERWTTAYRAAGNRSLSVGDVVLVGEAAFAVAPTSWDCVTTTELLDVGNYVDSRAVAAATTTAGSRRYDAGGNFEGHEPRACGEHRTAGPHRAWCFDCHEWCYPHDGCIRCRHP